MARVTVIVPSYNHDKFVAEAIQSVLDQTYQDFEIVITDDGSSDQSVSIIKSFTDPRIKLFCFDQNQGACVAGNKCLSEAKGEFIAMLSSDDVFAPDKLEKQVRFLDHNPDIGAVFSYAQIIDEDGNDLADKNHFYQQIFIQPNRTRFEWLNHFFFKGNCLCHPSVLIRKECYDQVGQFDERFAQLPDYDFWIRLCMKYEIHIIPEKLIKFRVRKNEINASGNRVETAVRHYFEETQILKKYLRDEICDDFIKIFPIKLVNNDSEIPLRKENVPFLLGMLAFQVQKKSYLYFGLNTIFETMGNKNIAPHIRDEYSFYFKNLIEITGNADIFNISKLEDLKLKLQQAINLI